MMNINLAKLPMNNRGFLTLDYLFAFILVIGISALLFAFTFSLSVIEVTQYMTFSAARNYFVAHENERQQEIAAQTKFANLSSDQRIASLFQSGWFEISYPESRLHLEDYEEHLSSTGDGPNYFRGVRVSFISKVLDFRIPFYGSTSNDPDGKGFSTKIGSYLGKEPNLEDCRNLNKFRWDWIRQLDSDYASVPTVKGSYRLTMDNGC